MMVDVDSCEVRFLFTEDLDNTDHMAIMESWYDLPDVEFAGDYEQMASGIRSGDLSFSAVSYHSISASVGVNVERPQNLPKLPDLMVDLDETYYVPELDEAVITRHVSDFVGLISSFYRATCDAGHRPEYVLGADPNQLEALHGQLGGVATTRVGVMENKIEQLYWLQIFPPHMAESVGRERLLSAPAWRVEEFKDGSILFVAYPNPHFPENEDAIADHVGIELPIYWI